LNNKVEAANTFR